MAAQSPATKAYNGVGHRRCFEFAGSRFQVRVEDLACERRRADAEAVREGVEQLLDDLDDGGELDSAQLRMILGESEVERHRPDGAGKRGRITGWSRKSRSNLLRTIAGLDLTGHWGMLTLTLPGDRWWEQQRHMKRLLRTFQKRIERYLGEPLVAIWKMEFQRRGAAHYHLGVKLPAEGWVEFGHACARAWHDVVCHADGSPCTEVCEHRAHLRYGAQLDRRYGARLQSGASAFASYFAKHGVWASKGYQHRLPGQRVREGVALMAALTGRVVEGDQVLGDWIDLAADFDCPGRWWGVWNAPETRVTEGEFETDELVAAKLVARKVIARRTWRYVETDQGTVLVRRSLRSLHGDAGFWLLVGNPSEFRWWFLDQVRTVAGLSGIERARYLATIAEPGARCAPSRSSSAVLVGSQ